MSDCQVSFCEDCTDTGDGADGRVHSFWRRQHEVWEIEAGAEISAGVVRPFVYVGKLNGEDEMTLDQAESLATAIRHAAAKIRAIL